MLRFRDRARGPRITAEWPHHYHFQVLALDRMLDLPLTDAVRSRMQRYLDQRRHRRLTRHRYALGDFGLTEAEVERAVRGDHSPSPEKLQALG